MGKKLFFFSVKIQYILALHATVLIKQTCHFMFRILGFVPFGANLIHLGPKSGHPEQGAGAERVRRGLAERGWSSYPVTQNTNNYVSYPGQWKGSNNYGVKNPSIGHQVSTGH